MPDVSGYPAAVPIVPGKLDALGGLVALDGRISWAPADAGYQPVGCYLLRASDPPTLVDTGLAVHRAAIVRQLRGLLPAESHLNVFLTRSEHETVGNLGAVMAAFDLDRLDNLYTGGGYNPFDGFDEAAADAQKRENRIRLNRFRPGAQAEPPGGLAVLAPAVRTLTTYWAYHPPTKTLFTSDLFGHTSLTDPGDPVIIDENTPDPTTVESTVAHLLAKFFWLEGARTASLREALVSCFAQRDVTIIAPTHGRILRGRSVVRRHLDLLLAALEAVSSDSAGKVAR